MKELRCVNSCLCACSLSRDKISMGRERLSAVIDPKDRNIIAYHEGGHAIMALFTPGAMPLYKATIVPRGPALGMVSFKCNFT